MSKANVISSLLLFTLPAMAQLIVNPADFAAFRPLAPGSPAVVFGNFSAASPGVAVSLPLPTSLGGLEVRVDGIAAPLYAVTASQVNFMVPTRVAAGRYTTTVNVQFLIKGEPAGFATILLRDTSPAILLKDAGAALRPSVASNQDESLNSQSHPARPGEVLTLYMIGEGTQLASSSPNMSPETVKRPVVFFGTWAGETIFSGPSLTQPGLWQVKVRLPQNANLPPGAIPLIVLFDGLTSNTATVWVTR